jgi:hypothetical protein
MFKLVERGLPPTPHRSAQSWTKPLNRGERGHDRIWQQHRGLHARASEVITARQREEPRAVTCDKCDGSRPFDAERF